MFPSLVTNRHSTDLSQLLSRIFSADAAFSSSPAAFPVSLSKDNEDTLLLRAELPGVPASDVEVKAENNFLVISVASSDDSESEKDNVKVSVHRFSGAQRRFSYNPEKVDVKAVSATMTDGVLSIRIPLKAPVSHHIQIATPSSQAISIN